MDLSNMNEKTGAILMVEARNLQNVAILTPRGGPIFGVIMKSCVTFQF